MQLISMSHADVEAHLEHCSCNNLVANHHVDALDHVVGVQ